jgi:hypothetical protein
LSEDTDLYTGGKVSAALPERRMLSIAFAHLPARAVHVFASLGIADILAAGPKHADEIAQAVGAHASSLYRLLRFLSTIEIVEEADDMRFSLTTLGKTLCTQPVSVVRDNVLLMGSPTYWSAFGELPAQIQTGENAFQKIYGGSFFDYLTGHSREAALFHQAMDSMSKMSASAIAAAYDFSGFECVVDVGGGMGALLISILKRNPSLRGILFDAASVIASSDSEATLSNRLQKVAGDIFDEVPSDGDVYILNRVLHNWDDATSIRILRTCRCAISSQGRLLVIEMRPPESRNAGNNWAGLDLLMMLLFDGRERSQADFSKILHAADFSLTRVVGTKSPFCIVEAEPV